MGLSRTDKNQLFNAAVEITDAADRAAYLDRACGNDPQLRAEIENLLLHDQAMGSFLESPPPELVATADIVLNLEKPGDTIGPYKLLQQLGEGGMGVVYLAERQHPVKQRVALKVIKQGMDTKQFLARFEAERSALAMMDHPNIAKVFDAGCTENGRPYFVMELVKGVDISKFCDENRLTTRARLGLFIQVCQAVQHAHQKGIIHRDLKPSNVLVAMYDDKPVPKVIDFGIAKATNQQLTERTLFTEVGSILGTWEYMSPEQAVLNQLDVDTRTDVYSLGVLLYELLTGETPLDRRRLREAQIVETLRLIREEEPPKPSTRISSLGARATTTAAYRGTNSESLASEIRGDLDWIVMKALAKERARRYDSASRFADDICRFLDNDLIEARPPSVGYQLQKFYLRNKTLTSSAVAIALALILGLAGALWGWRQAVSMRKELEIANQRNLLTIERLGDEITGRALNFALMGKVDLTTNALKDAAKTKTDKSLIRAIRGLADLYAGKFSKAIEEFNRAVELDPDSVPARSGLWLASLQTGRYDYMGREFRHILHLQPSLDTDDVTDTEKLFWVQMMRHTDPERAIEILEDLLRRHPDWGAVHSLLGRARVNFAKDHYRDPDALARFQQALADFQKAEILTPDSEFVLADYLLALLETCEFARGNNFAIKTETWMKKASDIAARLGPPTRNGGYGLKARTAYLAAIGDDERLNEIRDTISQDQSAAPWVRAAHFLANGQMEEYKAVLDSLGKEKDDKIRVLLELIYLATSQGHADDVSKAYDATFGGQAIASEMNYIALDAFLLLRNAEAVRNEATHLLRKTSIASGRWNRRILKYLASQTKASEKELKELAGPFCRERSLAYYAIGMVALATGNSEKAIECFDEVVKAGFLDTWYCASAFAFRQRILTDPIWPRQVAPPQVKSP